MIKYYILFISLVLMIACVGQEEPLDGLYKNAPVVVNTNEAFTFSLRAENYTTEENYTLSFSDGSPIDLTTVLIVTDFAGRATDTSYFDMMSVKDTLRYELSKNINIAPVKHLETDEIPNKIFFKADDFSGFIQFIIAIGD